MTKRTIKKKARMATWFFLLRKKLGRAIPTCIVPGPSGDPYFSQFAFTFSSVSTSQAFDIRINFAVDYGSSLFLSGWYLRVNILIYAFLYCIFIYNRYLPISFFYSSYVGIWFNFKNFERIKVFYSFDFEYFLVGVVDENCNKDKDD